MKSPCVCVCVLDGHTLLRITMTEHTELLKISLSMLDFTINTKIVVIPQKTDKLSNSYKEEMIQHMNKGKMYSYFKRKCIFK